jgi:hypothetical protein
MTDADQIKQRQADTLRKRQEIRWSSSSPA